MFIMAMLRFCRIVMRAILVNVQVQKYPWYLYSPCKKNWNFLERVGGGGGGGAGFLWDPKNSIWDVWSLIGISKGVGSKEIFWNCTLVSSYM